MGDGTTQDVERTLARLAAGESGAMDSLIGAASDRLKRLAARMRDGFPGVARWEETSDILQNALVRLCRAVQEVKPTEARHFFRIAARQIRWELLDLSRKYRELNRRHESHERPPRGRGGEDTSVSADPSDSTQDPEPLATWTEFHEQVALLEESHREMFELLWYAGLTQQDCANVLGIDERTVRRRWRDAKIALHDVISGKCDDSSTRGSGPIA